MSDKLGKMVTNVIEVEKNGVKVVIKQQYNKEINDINIDFSEHDKVFEDKIAKLEKELEEWKEEARVVKKQRDEQLKSFRKGIEPYVDLLHMHETIAELKQRIAELENENKQLKHAIDKMATSKSEWIDKAVEWQQKCEKLESKETDTNNDWGEPYTEPNIEWYDNRHQSDCIEINRLNTTIDVLIHKVEYLRQFAGLE